MVKPKQHINIFMVQLKLNFSRARIRKQTIVKKMALSMPTNMKLKNDCTHAE